MKLAKGTLQLTILLGVVILILVGIVGYLIWKIQKQPAPTSPTPPPPSTIPSPTPPQPPAPPQTSLKLLYPKGGEVWKEGETYKIKWEAKGVKKVNIEYGDGKNYFIVQNYPADKGEYEWTPKGIVEQYEGFVTKPLAEIQIKISVWDAENPNLYDKSDDITLISQETADWKVYRNEEYGFEFRYPKQINFGNGSEQLIVKENFSPVNAVFVAYVEKPFIFSVIIKQKPKDFSTLLNYVKNRVAEINNIKDSAAPIHAVFDEIVINNINGFKIETTAADVFESTDVEIYFEKWNYLVTINYRYKKALQEPSEVLQFKTIQKILSTFKFIQ